MASHEYEEKFSDWLGQHGRATCPCGHKFNLVDVEWGNGCTEAGTDYTFVEVVCSACGEDLVSAYSWWPGAGGIEEIVDHVLEDIEFKEE